MGTSHSSLALLHNIPDLEEAIKHSDVNPKDLKANGWSTRHSSDGIKVSSDGMTASLEASKGLKHGVRGTKAYEYGVHFFEFLWKPGSSKHVGIGICTDEAEMKSGTEYLLGKDEHSVSWDLVEKKIYYNGCAIKEYPDKKMASFVVPDKVVMMLNMDQGTLSFRTKEEDFGMAMSGLRHVAEQLFVAACMDTDGDNIQIKYLGGSDSMNEMKTASEGAASKDDATDHIEPLSFHKKTGQNVTLSENNTRASRKDPRKTYNSATVLTNRPLNDGETYQIKIEETDLGGEWSGSVVIGVTTLGPDEIRFPSDAMSECTNGDTWVLRIDELKHNGDFVQRIKKDLDDIQAKEILKITRSGEAIHVTCNSKDVTKFSTKVSGDLYGFVDVYGQTTAVKIIPGNTGTLKKKRVSHGYKTAAKHNASVSQLLEMMKQKKTSEISAVHSGVNSHLNNPSYGIKSRKHKRLAGQELTKADAGSIIKAYMEFLCSQPASVDAKNCYASLVLVCQCYSDASLQFAKHLGDTGALKFLMQHVTKMDLEIYNTKGDKDKLEQIMMIYHNCSQARENKEAFQSIKFAQNAKPIATNPDQYGLKASALAILAMSYVSKDDVKKSLKLSTKLAKYLVDIFGKCISSADNKFEEWHVRKLVIGITNLESCPENNGILVECCIQNELMKMLKFYDPYDKECALNALWGLITVETKVKISKTAGLLDILEDLKDNPQESVQQAAIRILTKLQMGQIFAEKDAACPYSKLCDRFKDSLGIAKDFFFSKFDMCYCSTCHAKRGDDAIYTRGTPPKDYGIPVGWHRYGLHSGPRASALNAFNTWHRAFHGTRMESLESILKVGELAPAGRKILGGKDIKELPGHFGDDWKPDGFNTKRIFLSPSIRYAGVDTYARPSKYKDQITSRNYNAKVAFQVLVNPDSYEVGPETIGAGEDEIDPGFSNQELEWIVEEQGSTLLYGLLVKLDGTW